MPAGAIWHGLLDEWMAIAARVLRLNVYVYKSEFSLWETLAAAWIQHERSRALDIAVMVSHAYLWPIFGWAMSGL